MTAIPEVLFVCVHNQGRSQMAAALLDHHAHGRVHVRSAGSEPAEDVNPDPSGKGPDAVREIRDEIDQRVRDLLAALVPDTTTA